MIRFAGKRLGLVLLAAATFFACSKKGNPEKEETGNVADRQAVLVNVTENIVIPSYNNFKTKLDLLVSKTDNFTTTPTNASLVELRSAWVNAYIEWQKVELLEFGSADRYSLRSYFNVYPANEVTIAANIASGTANLDIASNFTAQGFPAMDFLINGLGNTDAAIVSFYTTDADAAKRKAYLKSIVSKMNSVFTTVHAEWNGSYKETFISKTGTDASSSTSNMVNGYVRSYERTIRSGKFGIPSGVMLNGTVSPQNVEAFYKKDISLTLAKTAHQAAIDFFNGKSVKTGVEGPSLKTYLTALNAQTTLPEEMIGQFNASTQKLNAIQTENLSSVVQTNNQQMIDVYNEMQKSVRLLKVDMTSAISITITYTDNDGD
ncbi:imelysin family protein [Pedobacter sp. P351]|uniref:imelysin family protein n=1 Tax=Pedobacter superstes TaxID=3133441 RepID=UPI003094D612